MRKQLGLSLSALAIAPALAGRSENKSPERGHGLAPGYARGTRPQGLHQPHTGAELETANTAAGQIVVGKNA